VSQHSVLREHIAIITLNRPAWVRTEGLRMRVGIIDVISLARSFAGAHQSIGFGQTADAVYLPAQFGGTGDTKLVEAYGVRAFNHNWDPYWSSSLFGTASAVRYGGSAFDITTAKGQWCASYNIGKAVNTDYTCNPDDNVYQIGLITRWTPVKNLTFSAEVLYFRLDQKFTGTAPSAPKPTTVYEYKDQVTVSSNVRAQRNF
jgi:hypothetical protein